MVVTPVGVAIGISYKCALGDGKEVVFQSHVPQEIETKALDGILDKFRIAADRQAAFADLIQLEKALEQHISGYQNAAEQEVALTARMEEQHKTSDRRGAVRITPAEAKQRENFQTSMSQFKKMIERIEADIAKTKEKIGASA